MKRLDIFVVVAFSVGTLALTSCSDFLDKEASNVLTDADVLGTWSNLQEHHFDTYNFLRHGACRINNSWLDAATDLAHTSFGTGGVRTTFNIGNYYGDGGYNELEGTWESYYRGIRKCNQTITTLEADTANSLRTSDLTEETYLMNKGWLISEAKFLRAFFHWNMFLRYGPVPYVTEVLNPDGDLLTGYSDRPTLREFINDILADINAAEPDLMTYDQMSAEASSYAGRVIQPCVGAFRARIYLYMASPRYSSESGITWADAVTQIEKFINTYGGYYSLQWSTTGGVSAYTNAWLLNTYADGNPEVIWFRNDAAIGWSGILYDSPVGESGYGGCCPSQNLVDMYDMLDGSSPFNSYDATGAPVYTNGVPSINSASGYSDQTMWENRDPRLASTVLHNGDEWNSRTINVVYGGDDNPVGNSNSTKTGYYLKKYIPETILGSNHAGTAKRLWKIFCYNEILLSYAEALNEVSFDSNYETICELLDEVRTRAGITGTLFDRFDLTDQSSMRNFIHKERTIELAFEEHRWWDVRRWNVAGDALGRDIYGVDVASDGTITRKVAANRVWQDRFYVYPIPESEVWKIGTDFQNEEWR